MLRVAVIGTNFITERLIEAGNEVMDFIIAAVYSRTLDKATEFAARYDIQYIYTDIEEMAMSDHIDAVYIASPNSFHAQQAITCMKHGKHVLCEKPMSSNLTELEKMVDVAYENQVVLMEALKTTLLPNFQSIQSNLHKLGRIHRYFASYCKYSSRYDAYKEGTVLNAFNPVFSNGSLMDLGVYCIYPMVVLFGEPREIKTTSVMLESGVDGGGSVLLQYDGMEAVIMHSKTTNSYVPSEIQGENGSIIIDEISTPGHVEIKYRDGTVETISITQDKPSMYYELEEFVKLIKAGQMESMNNSHQHSRVTARIMQEARRQIGLVYPADE